MRFFLCFSYDGTVYHGMQRQNNGITIQQVLEERLSLFLRTNIQIYPAGRTDAGVHAEQMYAHFDYPAVDFDLINNGKLFAAHLNSMLPSGITILGLYLMNDIAHARYDATQRTYEYRIIRNKNSFYDRFRTLITQQLDVDLMNEAAKLLLGRQDFACFCKDSTDFRTTLCTVFEAEWFSSVLMNNTDQLVFRITANRFLRNMVRAVVGTLLKVGINKISKDDFAKIIESKNRHLAGQSAPARGLFLTKVTYPAEIFLQKLF